MNIFHAFTEWLNAKTVAFATVVGGAALSWSLSGFLSGLASTIAILVGVTHLYDWLKKRRKGK